MAFALLAVLGTAAGCTSAPPELRSARASPADVPREIVLAPRPVIVPASGEEIVALAARADLASTPFEPTFDRSAVGDVDESRHTIVATGAGPEVVARERPDESGAVIRAFANPTERGGPLVFQAIGEPEGGWIEVRLPIRPNGTTGWIRVADVTLSRNPYRVDIDVDGFELTVYQAEEPVLTTTVAIGTGATPTPIGDFFLTELFQPPDPDGLYGPYAYGLSGFSDTIDSFNGGPGIIGIHGTDQPELLGSNVSHGCVRVDNAIITEMASFLPLGTPITIRR